MTKTIAEILVDTEIHAYRTIVIPNPTSPLGKPITKNRGDTFILTAELLGELADRHGNFPKWLEEIDEPDPYTDEEPVAALGPWPEGKSIFIRGELSWKDERSRRLGDALAIADPAEKQKAITAINRELGLPLPQNNNTYNY